jgi:LDH2 family malate/lactate/ureidoglycolate dehydrogenase
LRLGASREEAAIVSDSLVEADLEGHDSHGVMRLPTYVERVKRGFYTLGAKADTLVETPSMALLDGNWGFGHVIARKAMEIAITKAKMSGISYVGVRNANHIGRLAHFAKMALKENLIAIIAVNSAGPVAPHGGKSPIMGTNPICFAVPSDVGFPFILDMATSVVASGKVLLKQERGESVPEDWIIDRDGRPTTDSSVFGLEGKGGMLLPLGGSVGYKGFGLSLMMDLLGGVLTGAGATAVKLEGIERRPNANGISIICIDMKQITQVDLFKERANALVRSVKQSEVRPGFTEILIPGEPSSRMEKERTQKGIEVHENVWRKLKGIARELDIDTKKGP